MNSYTFEDPITSFTNDGFTNLARHFGGLAAYSYVFDGESGYLDHALASASLAAQATGTTHWHINADEPIALDYNVEFKSANQVNSFYDPGPYRASDHDPVVIGLTLNTAPTATFSAPSSSFAGFPVHPLPDESDRPRRRRHADVRASTVEAATARSARAQARLARRTTWARCPWAGRFATAKEPSRSTGGSST
jgi:Predicted extracellular nuclease